MTSRLSGIQPWYQVPSSLRTVVLSRSGALHGRNNGRPFAASHERVWPGSISYFGTAKEEASWLTPDDLFLRFGEYLTE